MGHPTVADRIGLEKMLECPVIVSFVGPLYLNAFPEIARKHEAHGETNGKNENDSSMAVGAVAAHKTTTLAQCAMLIFRCLSAHFTH